MLTWEQFLESITAQERAIVEFYSRILMVASKDQPRILEVGSGWGLFSRAVLEQYHENKKLHFVTIDKIGGYGLDQFVKNTAGFEGAFEAVTADSHELLPTWQEKFAGYFDLIFVDGDHTLAGASQDLKDCWPLLKSGGKMIVDDIFHRENFSYFPEKNEFNFGVTQALWGMITAHSQEFSYPPSIFNFGHGVVLIEKK